MPIHRYLEPIGVKGIGTKATSSHDFISIPLKFQDKDQAREDILVSLLCGLQVVPKLAANILIRINMINRHKININISGQQVTISTCEATIPVRIKPEKDY